MSLTLIIAEKPSVGRDIARVLDDTFKQEGSRTHIEGKRYIITWAIGHLASPADPEKYDPAYKRWVFADLPIIPEKFKLTPGDDGAALQLKAIKDLMSRKDVTGVINACDAGREGELIFAYVYQLCRVRKPVERLWLSSMTDQAIKEAFAALKPGSEYKRLEDAARSRSEADWIVGINATRAATVKTRGAFDGVVSLGRVQTPTLAMIVHRELEIRDFDPKPYWVVKGLFTAKGSEPGASEGERAYSGMYLGGKRLDTAEEAAAIAEAANGKTGAVTKVETKESGEACDLLYDLTSLQRHANQRFGFSAERTLAAAQKLYEQHKALTYPRTSSRFLTSDMAAEIQPIAQLLTHQEPYREAAEYVAALEKPNLKRVVNDAKVTDHHAIIPTKSEVEARYFADDERKIYDLVTKRFLAIFHPDAVWAKTKLETTVETHVFRTAGKVLISAGWRAVYGTEGLEDKDKDKGDDDEGDGKQLPLLVEGEPAHAGSVEAIEKATKPPKRYNESSLLGAMETAGKDIDDDELREAMKESGIGTPATRASIIERLLRVGYIRREGKQLRAEVKGIEVIELLDGHPITSAELTGSWEARLSHIEQATDSRKDFMRDIAEFSREMIRQLGELKVQVDGLGPCPSCERPILETSKSYSCWTADDPGCGFTIWKEKSGATISETAARQLLADGETAEPIKGFRAGGKKFDAKLKLAQNEHGRWGVQFADEAIESEHGQAALDQERMIAPCPICKKPVFDGNKSYSCWTREDKGCGFTIWKTVSGHTLTPDEARHLIRHKRSEKPVVMVSKAGKPFAAWLVLKRRKDDGSAAVRFDFENVDQNAVIAEHTAEQERIKAEQAKAKAEREAKRKAAAKNKPKPKAKPAGADIFSVKF